MDDVFLDNLPDTANMILNVLWSKEEEMSIVELMEAVNGEYHTRWTKEDIRRFANLLVISDYAEKRHRGWKTYFAAIGAKYEL